MAEYFDYTISTVEVEDLSRLDKLDTKNSSRERDGATIKIPSYAHACPIQLWEVYFCTAVLVVQPHSTVLSAHVQALCEHDEPQYLCEAILKEHLCIGTVTDNSQDTNLYTFFDEYFSRKFQIHFPKNSLHKYAVEVLDDPLCGKDRIPRCYLVAPHVQAFLLNAPFFDGQYDELLHAMRMANLPVNDVLKDGGQEIGEAIAIRWDAVKLYDDPNMILKRHGGWALSKVGQMMTPKDQLMLRLTGCTLQQILEGRDVPDSPQRGDGDGEPLGKAALQHQTAMLPAASPGARGPAAKAKTVSLEDDGDDFSDSDSSHASDFDIDAEHRKVVPIGATICEMYLLVRGLLVGLEASSSDWRGSVVGQQVAGGRRDGHALAAAVLVDLYMRDQIDVHHWTLTEGNIAVAYRVERRKGLRPMDHFLDAYAPHAENIFRDMQLPSHVGEGPIWVSLEQRGVIDNHRPSWERAWGCGFKHVDVWDLARPDLLLDLKDGYLLSARVLYDKGFPNPLDEAANDVLMFCYLLQALFDASLEAIDGMSRVLSRLCPPFQKGELYPPAAMVHGGAVCMGLIDRAFRLATGGDTQLALEAAEFNEAVMARLEDKFFLSPAVWESMDTDQSGELTVDEFVEGMRQIDVYQDFRRERIPEEVLRSVVADLAERLFREVDVNMDGTLTTQELQAAFRRRREQAMKKAEERRWFRRAVNTLAVQMGLRAEKAKSTERVAAARVRDEERARIRLEEVRGRNEYLAEVERPELQDADVDIDTSFTTNL